MPDLAGQPIGHFLDRLAARVPAPGGGATAALHAAQAAALIGMVARYSTGSRYAEHADLVERIIDRSDLDRGTALDLAVQDAAAFTAVTAAYALPQGSRQEKQSRSSAIGNALRMAAAPPADVITLAVSLVAVAEELLPVANRNVITDIAAATEAARAAATTARLNIEINLAGITDQPTRDALHAVLGLVEPLVERAAAVDDTVRATLQRPTRTH